MNAAEINFDDSLYDLYSSVNVFVIKLALIKCLAKVLIDLEFTYDKSVASRGYCLRLEIFYAREVSSMLAFDQQNRWLGFDCCGLGGYLVDFMMPALKPSLINYLEWKTQKEGQVISWII